MPSTAPSTSFWMAGFFRSMDAMGSPLLRRLVRRHTTLDLESHRAAVTERHALRDVELDAREHRRALEPRHEIRDHEVRHRHTLERDRAVEGLVRGREPQVIRQRAREVV